MMILKLALISVFTLSAYGQRSFCKDVDVSSNLNIYNLVKKIKGLWKPEIRSRNFSFCVEYLSDKVDYSQVLYYFHGVLGSEKTWFEEKYDKIRAELVKSNLPLPPIVTLSFGKTWLVTESELENPYSGLLEQIVDEVFPYIEHFILRTKNPKRIGYGMSMGGFNITQIYLSSPNTFDKIALTCPAMSSENPFNDFKSIKEYAKRNNAKTVYVAQAVKLSRKYFQTSEGWVKNSPLERLKLNNMNHLGYNFYISAVSNDEYGFNEGDTLLANALQSQGARVKWEYIDGDHCDINQASLASFFLGL